MAVQAGDRYISTGPAVVGGIIYPGDQVVVRDVGSSDEAFAGDLVVETGPTSEEPVGRAVGLTFDELALHFTSEEQADG